MPQRRLHVSDWEAFDHVVKVRFTESQVAHLDALVASLEVSRSWLLRRAVAAGLPTVVAELRSAAQRDYAVRAVQGPTGLRARRRGPRRLSRNREVYLPVADPAVELELPALPLPRRS